MGQRWVAVVDEVKSWGAIVGVEAQEGIYYRATWEKWRRSVLRDVAWASPVNVLVIDAAAFASRGCPTLVASPVRCADNKNFGTMSSPRAASGASRSCRIGLRRRSMKWKPIHVTIKDKTFIVWLAKSEWPSLRHPIRV